MAIPSAPQENGGDKILFSIDDSFGVNRANVFRGYKHTTMNSENVADLGVYSTSGNLAHGSRLMTGGDSIALSSTSTPCQGVLVKAYSTNGSTVYVGISTVTADTTPATGGYPLEPGESVGVPCRNVTEVYICGTGSDGVAWIASAD